MLYNVYDYSNQIIGQVEASSAVEAWPIAGRNFSEHQILDVRLVEFAGQIPPKFSLQVILIQKSLYQMGQSRHY